MQWGVTMDECGRGAGAQRLRERGRHARLSGGSVNHSVLDLDLGPKKRERAEGKEGKGRERKRAVSGER